MTTDTTSDTRRTRRTRRTWLTVLAAALHLATLPLFASSGLLAPGWAVVLLLLAWAGLGGVLARLRGRPQALLVPAVAVALWFLALTAGEQLLGWTG